MRNPKTYLKEILKKVLPKYCRGKVVDVGAGRGKYRDLIRAYAGEYVSVDNMSSEYQYTKDDFRPDVISDVLHMPFAQAEFDTLVCTEVLEHVPDPFQLFIELSRILKPGGYAIVSSGWIAAYHEEPKDYWRFTIDAYKVLCERGNLEFVEAYKKGGLFTVMLYLTHRNIVLRVKNRFVIAFWRRIRRPFELLAEYMDRFIETEDTIGHVIVARKPR